MEAERELEKGEKDDGLRKERRTLVAVSGGELDEEDRQKYIDYAWQKYGREPSEIVISLYGDQADLAIYFKPVMFDRIKRLEDWREKERQKEMAEREERWKKMFE